MCTSVTLEFLLSAFLPDESEGRFLHAPNPIAETAAPVETLIEMVIHRRPSERLKRRAADNNTLCSPDRTPTSFCQHQQQKQQQQHQLMPLACREIQTRVAGRSNVAPSVFSNIFFYQRCSNNLPPFLARRPRALTVLCCLLPLCLFLCLTASVRLPASLPLPGCDP